MPNKRIGALLIATTFACGPSSNAEPVEPADRGEPADTTAGPERPSEVQPEQPATDPTAPQANSPRANSPRANRDQCDLFVDVAVARTGDSAQLTASLVNESDTSVTVQIEAPCPGGFARFSGLPDGYQYHATCAMGVCQKPTHVRAVEVPANGSAQIDDVTLNLDGGVCVDPLPPARYELSAMVVLLGQHPSLCQGHPATLDLRG